MNTPFLLMPAIILVETQLGENIGAAARAMANFGLSDLRLVAPRDGWPNQKARDMATTGRHILDNATLFATTKDAIADLQLVFATTGRGRDMMKPVSEPEQVMEEIITRGAEQQRCGILFGPERTGLTNDDVTLCEAIVTIPTDPDYASLNIGQSVVVMAYEWFRLQAKQQPSDTPKGFATTSSEASPVNPKNRSPLASKQEVQGFFDHLESELDRVDFWKVADKKPVMWRNLRGLFIRSSLTEQDVRTLRGLLRSLAEGKK